MSVKTKTAFGCWVLGAMFAMPTLAQAGLWHCTCNPTFCVCVMVY
jgi:hypothetical protein